MSRRDAWFRKANLPDDPRVHRQISIAGWMLNIGVLSAVGLQVALVFWVRPGSDASLFLNVLLATSGGIVLVSLILLGKLYLRYR